MRPAPRRAFGEALALARTTLARTKDAAARSPETGFASAATSTALVLTRRRRGADEGQRKLSERREEAEPGVTRRPEGERNPAGDLRPLDTAPRPALVSAAAVERLAMEIGRMSGRPFVELSFGRDLRVRITRSPRGVEVLLAPSPKLRWAASAELPGFLAALRARGVAVASARVSGGATAEDRACERERGPPRAR